MKTGLKKSVQISAKLMLCVSISPLLPVIGLMHLIAAMEN